ncbi:hypothetical protein VTP01DRAFT_4639 [Rhizomucor pusillus]|uniref:uncharacterized protein n=1 Tax=Rhizomucor pusillus TaxID=4840 RepID=UPI003742F60F
MSLRAIRRLQQQQEIEEAQKLEEEQEELSEEEHDRPQKAQNLFDLLNEGDDDNEDQELEQGKEEVQEEQVNEEPEEQKANDRPRDSKPSKAKQQQQSSGSKKGKKKNKKKKTAAESKKKTGSDMSMQELDEILKQVSVESKDQGETGTATENNTEQRRSLLSVEYKYLDAEAEMKRMFGSRVVNSESRLHPSGRNLKKQKLANPKVDWYPYRRQGLSMETVDTKNGISYFVFKHDDEYQEAQFEFLSAVATHNPNALMFLLSRYPYHVDTLLQVSEMAKQSGDWTMAGDCIERALYASERAFHPQFQPYSGTSRLSYRNAENRSFFLAIFRHIQFLTRRGCWRTAFEFNKLLFSVNPESDPLGALLSLDVHALSAKQYQYVVQMYSNWKTSGELYPVDLTSLPNFSFSAAYAQYKLEGGKSHQKSSEMLQEAIVKFPSTIPRLFEKLGESGSVNEQHFLQIPTSDYLDLLIALFVERTFEFFKEPEVLEWLKSNAHLVVEKDLVDASKAHAKVDCVQSDEIPLSVSRHIVLLDIQQLLSYLPSSIKSSSFHMYDPLPPPDSIRAYEHNGRADGPILPGLGNLPRWLGELINTHGLRQLREQLRQHRIPGAFPEDEEDVVEGQVEDDNADDRLEDRHADEHGILDEEIPDEDIELQLAMMASMDESRARQQNNQEHRE